MSRKPPIGLGDLVRAVRELGADADTASLIARLLDLEGLRETAARVPVSPPMETRRPESDALDEVRVTPDERARPTGPEATPDARTIDPGLRQIRLDIHEVESAHAEEPLRLGAALAPSRRRARDPALPFGPLFQPQLTRAILTGVSRTWHRDGPADTDAMVEAIVRRRPFRELRRQPLPTLRMGVQVLVDRGDGMLPFARDVEHLVAMIARVVGNNVAVRSFAETPLKTGTGPRRLWMPYEPPPVGTPVLALTDLGIARPAPEVVPDWLVLSDRLRRGGSRLVAIVPWPARRHPPPLADAFATVVWDRPTTLSTLHRNGALLRRARS